MIANLPSSHLTLGLEPAFNSLMLNAKGFSKNTWDPKNPSTGAHSFVANIGTTLLLVPIELFAAAENALKLPLIALSTVCFELPLSALGFTATLLSCHKIGSYLIDLQTDMPGTLDLLVTMYKVVTFVIGAASTLLLGLVSTEANYKVHQWLGLLNPDMIPTTNEWKEPQGGKKPVPGPTAAEEDADLNSELSDVKSKLKEKQQEIEKLQKDSEDQRGAIEEFKHNLKKMTSERDALTTKLAELEKTQPQIAETEALKKRVAELDANVLDATKKLEIEKAALVEMTEKHAQANAKAEATEKSRAALDKQLAQAIAEKDALTTEKHV